MRSSFIPRYGSISAVSAPSRKATKSSATKPASKLSRTRLLLLSNKQNSTSCMAGVSRAKAQSLILAYRKAEERRVGKEGVRTCRSRWSPYHYIKHTKRDNHL